MEGDELLKIFFSFLIILLITINETNTLISKFSIAVKIFLNSNLINEKHKGVHKKELSSQVIAKAFVNPTKSI